jgi:hypothetical protein
MKLELEINRANILINKKYHVIHEQAAELLNLRILPYDGYYIMHCGEICPIEGNNTAISVLETQKGELDSFRKLVEVMKEIQDKV